MRAVSVDHRIKPQRGTREQPHHLVHDHVVADSHSPSGEHLDQSASGSGEPGSAGRSVTIACPPRFRYASNASSTCCETSRVGPATTTRLVVGRHLRFGSEEQLAHRIAFALQRLLERRESVLRLGIVGVTLALAVKKIHDLLAALGDLDDRVGQVLFAQFGDVGAVVRIGVRRTGPAWYPSW